MKMVAAAKLRRAQEAIFSSRPYAFKLREMAQQLMGQVDPEVAGLPGAREDVRRVLVVVISADRGLAGAFNTNIIKTTEALVRDELAAHKEAGTLSLICVGRKGHKHFANRGYDIVGNNSGFFSDLRFDRAAAIVTTIREGYENGLWDQVFVVYNEFKNTIAQNRIIEPFLPIPDDQFQTPVMESSSDYTAADPDAKQSDYIFDPSAAEMLRSLLGLHLNAQMWRIVLESNASEQGARMVAMDNATTNAGELLGRLQLSYNQARQAAITTEILEISSGAEALKNQS